MPDIFDQIEEPKVDIFDQVSAPPSDIFDEVSVAPTEPVSIEEPGRITKQPQSLKEWGSFLLGGVLHPIRQTETLIEQFATQTGLAKPGERLKVRPSELMEQPAVTIPKVPPQEGPVAKVAGGLANATIDLAQFFLTPEGAMSMGLGSLKEPVRRAVMLDFAGQMATAAPEQFNAAYAAAKRGDLQGAVQHAAGGTGGAILTGVLAKKGAFKDVESAPKVTEEITPELKAEPVEPAKAAEPEVEPSASAVGIVPPSSAAIRQVGTSLQRAWEGLKTAVKTSPNKQDMAAHMDAAENAARIAGQQEGNSVRVQVPNELDRKAITFIIEAQENPAVLDDFLTKTTGKDLNATRAIEHAKQNYDRLKPLADEVSNKMEQQRLFEESQGVDTDYVEGYIKHAYDRDLLMGKSRPVILAGGGGGGVSSGFKKQRVFATYADAIEAGYKPQSLDAATLVDSRISAGTKLVNRRQWGEALRDVTDPTSGKPIVETLITQPKGTQVAPAGYVPREILPGVRVAVHEGYEKMFDAITGGSAIGEFEVKGVPVGQIALKTEGAIKHGLLAFDTFHASRIAQKMAFLTGKVGYKSGKTLLEYSDADLADAVKQDLITREMADYAKTNRPTANLLIKEGLNVGRVQEALYADVVKNVPVIGRFNKWVFEKLTRGAMMESGIIEFERVKRQNPEMTDSQVARKVSQDLNTYFGNLGRQGIFKSKTAQDLLRLAFLAPQWVESMVQTEARGYGQLAKTPIDSVRAGQLRTGTLAKGVGQGLAAYFVATQLLNLATRGKPTWENDEKEHKLDAWIPDVTGDTGGYFISPFSVAAEVSHDFIRYSPKEGVLGAAGKITANKLSPLGRAEEVLRTGEDYSGTKLYGTWARVKEAAWSLAPTPIPLSAPIRGTSYPGQTQRQLLGSAGLKVEPARKEFPMIVEKWHIASRQGFEEYLNSIARHARTLPVEQRRAYLNERLKEDGVARKYRKEAERKLKYKLRP